MSDERLLETFLDLVRIESPPGFEAATAKYCARELEAAECRVWFDDAAEATASDTGNLIAELAGNAPGVLALSAHLDVVEPCRNIQPVVTDGVIHSAGPTILGADDRAGLAAAIETVRRVAESDASRPTVRVIFTVQEEVGLHGAKFLRPEDVACDLCLVLDAEGAPGGIVVGAPTHYTFTAEFSGRASHAGVAPEKGVSAIAMAAHAIDAMQLGRLDERTTANVGSIRGGRATNVVTARCDMTGECRSLDRERVEGVRAAMDTAMKASAERFGGSVDVCWHLEYEGFEFPTECPQIDLVSAAIRDAGCEPTTYHTGGGSDANVLATLGVPTLALACGMTGVHGTSEQITVADLCSLTAICEAVVGRMARAAIT
jgi:tripeptide aminopeptidase